jgi:hypothetical protein
MKLNPVIKDARIMTNPSSDATPLVIQLAGKTVFSGEVSILTLLSLFGSTAQTTITALAPEKYKSYALTPPQAEQLLRNVDPKTADFLKAIAQGNGEIKFGEMQKIFGIKEWTDFTTRFGKGLTRALRHLTDNSSAKLLWWDDEEWKSETDKEGPVYIDGPALKSLRTTCGLEG